MVYRECQKKKVFFILLPQEKYYAAEDFYNMPENIHAELINGEIVYMDTPSWIHQELLGELLFVMKSYIILTVNEIYREYWIADPQNKKIHDYNMEQGNFTVNTYSFQDTVKAGIYDDLFIDFSSLDLGVQL